MSGLERIHKLDEAANFLMLVSDGETGLGETCHLTTGEALNLLGPLHAMIDGETKNNKTIITAKHLTVCEENCHCGIYSDLARNKHLKSDLLMKAQTFPKKKLIDCAELTSKWFCNSSLLRELKKEAETPSGL